MAPGRFSYLSPRFRMWRTFDAHQTPTTPFAETRRHAINFLRDRDTFMRRQAMVANHNNCCKFLLY